jgi:beta-lactamase superfamily II metal-dependent hydrolase
MNQDSSPGRDELELSLFGPGFGESVVVHLGGGKWMIVDSCIDQTSGRPVALRYLEQLRVDVSQDVALVVVTHWHDDHIQGAAQVVREATNAKFACSAALKTREFFVLLNAAREEIKLVDNSSGVSEFAAILKALNGRSDRQSPHYWAAEGTVLFENPADGIEVRALSPSAETITQAATTIGNLLPTPGSTIKRIPEHSPNDLSVVLLIRSPQASVLLGGDLETSEDPHRGWRAVVASAVRPAVRSIGFKVSHHGSHNGDLPAIWTNLLAPAPFALLTPYGRGKKPLPSPEDVKRITAQTTNLFSTVWPPTVSPKFDDKAVKRTVDEVLRDARTTRGRPGHLRLRVPIKTAAAAALERFDGAVKL